MTSFVLVTDRGGHLHNALMLLEQMGVSPDAIVTTHGPDIDSLKVQSQIHSVPYLFTWLGQKRFFNPVSFLRHVLCLQIGSSTEASVVISVGASNVVFFCYWARLLGARIIHVDCMNQVKTASITGRMLYPICSSSMCNGRTCSSLWPKARYEGWVL